MAKFVQLLTFESSTGKFDQKKDTQTINKCLEALQDDEATIISVTPSLAGRVGYVSAVYVILYEAPEPIEFR